MTVPAGKVRRAGRYAGEWALFCDWCRATNRVPLPATQATVLAFLDEEAPTGGTATRWLTGITAHHAAAGHPTPCRGVVAAWAAAARAGTPTTGAQILASLAQTIGRVPVAGWPAGMIGRRDRLAFLIHHLGGVPVEDLCTLTTDDLTVTGPGTVALTVRGNPVTLFQDESAGPGLCIACAATRFAQVLRHHAVFAHRILADKLTATPPGRLSVTGAHVCDRAPVPAPAAWWPPGWPLFYGIDHRGHPTGVPVPDPITPRALGTVLRAIDRGTWSRRPAPLPPVRYDNRAHSQPPAKTTRRPGSVPVAGNPGWHRDGVAARARDHALLADADAALDALDQAADDMQERMHQILGAQVTSRG